MRILIVNWKHPADPAAGGAEQYVCRVAEIWAEQGHEVALLVPRPRGRGNRSGVLPQGVEVLAMGSRRTIFRSAKRYLARSGTQWDAVLESISTRPFFAHEQVDQRVVALYHQIADDVWEQEFRFPVSWVGRHVLEPRWLRRIAGATVVANSPSTVADLARHGVRSTGFVPPGVRATLGPTAIRRAPEQPRLIFMGRLVRTKRPLDAVRAFELIRASFPEATLDIIGTGYLLEQLRRRACPGVRLHGYVSEESKKELLDQADLMLLPGTREGWGIVALEAGLHGLPVVAYDIPGLRDSTIDGETGVLTRCAPEAMARAAVSLLADPARMAAMGAANRQRSARYTWERTAGELLAIMKQVLPGTEMGSAA